MPARATRWMIEPLRALERRFYSRLLHPAADDLSHAPVAPWDTRLLEGHHYCLLVSYRRDGRPVPTPVWFARGCDPGPVM